MFIYLILLFHSVPYPGLAQGKYPGQAGMGAGFGAGRIARGSGRRKG